jgi:glycosyltransferase involved in cell wall biosynthesis
MSPRPAPELPDGLEQARADVARAWDAAADQGAAAAVTSRHLSALVAQALDAADPETGTRAVWLLLVALTGALPGLKELEDAWLTLRAAGAADVVTAAVTAAVEPARSRSVTCTGSTLVDVTITAGTRNLAGVPRVVRELVRAWGEPAGVEYVVWEESGLRTLALEERASLGLPAEAARPPGTWVVPWQARYVVVEVMRPEAHASAVEAMALAGAVDLRGVVYDLASLVEPHPDATNGPFLHHLSALSRATAVSGISDAVAADVSDYFAVLARNGRPAPRVAAHVLPSGADVPAEGDPEADDLGSRLRGDPTWPVVLAVSSLHRRKNHARLLAACEQLWDEGLRFRLVAVEGTGSRVPAVAHAVDRMVEHGRPVTLLSHVSEPTLWAAYRLARVTAYVSLAEGYGLPIVESLAAGTPVVTSGHGSMAEIAAAGGVLLVDPRDEAAVTAGLRRVLTEPELYDELLAGVAARRHTSWGEYAETVGAYLGVLPGTDGRAPELQTAARATGGSG